MLDTRRLFKRTMNHNLGIISSMRLRKTRKKQKGGKILGAGADGCIFSESAWPCSTETDISGYDVSDPKFVTKMVEKSDNEDKIIAIAASILTGADAKHLITNYGTCSPVDNTTTDPTKMAALDENMANIIALQQSSKENACEKLSDLPSSEIQKTRKILVNSRFNSDLHNYIKKYANTTNVILNVLKAAIPFLAALKKLATNSGNRLVNLDLHNGNIFVNFNTLGGPLTMGIADYGRCAYYDVKKNNMYNKATWSQALVNYISEYDLQVNFSMIPVDSRLLNAFVINNRLNSEADIINHIVQLVKNNRSLIDTPSDPFYFVGETQLPKLLNIFTPFLTYVIKFPTFSVDKKMSLLDFMLYRYITVGFVGSIITSLTMTAEFVKELSAIKIAAEDYIKFYGDSNYQHKFNMNLLSHRLVKLYFDELLAPYMNDFSDIEQIAENEKNRDFPKIFENAMKLNSIIVPPGPPGLPPGLPRRVIPIHQPPPPILPPRRNGKTTRKRR